MELKDYPLEFVERTQRMNHELREHAKSQNLEVTFLLNSLLGTIVAINENMDKIDSILSATRNNPFKRPIFHDENLIAIIPKEIEFISAKEIKRQIKREFQFHRDNPQESFSLQSPLRLNLEFEKWNRKKVIDKMSINKFLNLLRNSIAHQNLVPINKNKLWDSVYLYNTDSYNFINFKVIMKISEIESLSNYFISMYIKVLKNAKKT